MANCCYIQSISTIYSFNLTHGTFETEPFIFSVDLVFEDVTSNDEFYFFLSYSGDDDPAAAGGAPCAPLGTAPGISHGGEGELVSVEVSLDGEGKMK